MERRRTIEAGRDLVDRGIIRVLDVLFVVKEQDGSFSGFGAENLDSTGVGAFAAFWGGPGFGLMAGFALYNLSVERRAARR